MRRQHPYRRAPLHPAARARRRAAACSASSGRVQTLITDQIFPNDGDAVRLFAEGGTARADSLAPRPQANYRG